MHAFQFNMGEHARMYIQAVREAGCKHLQLVLDNMSPWRSCILRRCLLLLLAKCLLKLHAISLEQATNLGGVQTVG